MPTAKKAKSIATRMNQPTDHHNLQLTTKNIQSTTQYFNRPVLKTLGVLTGTVLTVHRLKPHLVLTTQPWSRAVIKQVSFCIEKITGLNEQTRQCLLTWHRNVTLHGKPTLTMSHLKLVFHFWKIWSGIVYPSCIIGFRLLHFTELTALLMNPIKSGLTTDKISSSDNEDWK